MEDTESTKASRNDEAKIVVFDVKSGNESDFEEGYSGVVQAGAGGRILKFLGIKATEITVEQVQQNMVRFVSSMQRVIDKSSEQLGEYNIDTVEVNAEISADGEIGFMGTHVGMSGTAGIMFVFKKDPSKGPKSNT